MIFKFLWFYVSYFVVFVISLKLLDFYVGGGVLGWICVGCLVVGLAA